MAHLRVAVEPLLLACCAVEVATAWQDPVAVNGVRWVAADDQPDVTVVVIAGTITRASLPRIEQAIRAAAQPRAVLAFGVCASSGGPYWDSEAVVQGWTTADLLVPGCPPPPSVFWSSVAQAAQQVMARAAS
ncbi:MAG: NADH-quinone oxidoreductase subunit B family protein [Candidatus Nanopelagicales bacterium]